MAAVDQVAQAVNSAWQLCLNSSNRVEKAFITLAEHMPEISDWFSEGQRRTTIIPRFTSESSGLTRLFAVLVDASEGWRGVRMPAYIRARLEQLAEHPESEWEDLDLVKLAA